MENKERFYEENIRGMMMAYVELTKELMDKSKEADDEKVVAALQAQVYAYSNTGLALGNILSGKNWFEQNGVDDDEIDEKENK